MDTTHYMIVRNDELAPFIMDKIAEIYDKAGRHGHANTIRAQADRWRVWQEDNPNEVITWTG